jgi:segregation and condensation protein B
MVTTPTLLLTEEKIVAIIECLLFVADHPVSITELANTLEISKRQVEAALTTLNDDYANRALRLQRKDNQIQLVTAPEAADYIERFLGLSQGSKLSTAALESLGIIAYKQPLTRSEVEAIRGVNSDGVLRTLLSKGLIEEVGRLDTVGHPIQYGTTFTFLQYFGLSSLADLPELEMEADTETEDETDPQSVAEAGPIDEVSAFEAN